MYYTLLSVKEKIFDSKFLLLALSSFLFSFLCNLDLSWKADRNEQ